MIPRHARRSLSIHRVPPLRISSHSSPRSILSLPQGVTPSLGRRCVVTGHCRPWRRRTSDAAQNRVRGRHLATAVGDLNLDGISYSQLNDSTLAPFQAQALPSQTFDSFGSSIPIVIPQPTTQQTATRTSKYGVPGDTADMLSVFEACIRVGKLERAALVLKRLNDVAGISDEERIVIHNQYLRASLRQIRATNDRHQAEDLHKWYELQIRNQGLPHTAETVACMLKTSLLSERGARLKRLVKRYMGMAPGEAGLQVLNMADILSGQDLAVITEICPTYNYAAEPDEADGTLEAQVEEARAGSMAKPGQSVPELQATPQRGEGLATLRKGLELIKDIQDVDISKFSEADRREIQLQLERDSISSAIARWRLENKNRQQRGINTAFSHGSFNGSSLPSHMASWHDVMERRLKEEFKLIEASEQKAVKSETDLERCLYGPLIQQADPSRLAAVTILATLNCGAATGADKGVPVAKLVANIAKLAEEDIMMQEREKSRKAQRKHKVNFNGDAAAADTSAPSDIRIQDSEPSRETWQKRWSLQARSQVGAVLLKIIIESARMRITMTDPFTQEEISQYHPAFSHGQQVRRGRKIGVITWNANLVEHMKREPMGDYLAKHLPMVVEPKPWKSLSEGGFLEARTSVIRVQPGDVEQRLYTQAAIKSGDFKTVFKGLDALGKTAWRVNKDVLGVMMEAWNRGEELANMPPANPNLEIPPEPEATDDNIEQHRQWVHTVKAIENERAALHSQRCFMNLQLEIARAFRNQTIYFPHNVDYRGRAYPIPTYLNHMGADHTRGLLTFAAGKELGTRGLRWLKIHLANVYGMDKASFDEREAFAMDNMANISESVTNPLDGDRWWLRAEDPWQCLAACFELKAAMELPDPTKHVSHLPVQQDGTCNGLQHYAALGGDTWGAKQVNLEPGDRPADVYSAVAELVKEAIAKDAAEGQSLAKALEGKVARKVVKQTVMTNVYGVTFAGAKKQVCKQIDALYPTIGAEHDTKNIVFASYIAKQIFTALATMFRGAHDIQYWLGEAGGRVCTALTPAQLNQIAEDFKAEETKNSSRKSKKARPKRGQAGLDELMKSFRSTVVWTTPLRMPVAQPYRKATMKEVRTCFQSLTYPVNDQTDPVNRKKQLQGFPPNFIHSLDASHMLLSALQCYDLGLDFAAVHDSFWTHASDVDTMNEVLRNAFIKIHEEDVIGRLASEFKARHHGSLYLTYIDGESAVAKKIKDLRKNSKLSPKEELLLEHKRNTLRLSGNPWDLEAAKQIVTPASVYEDMAASEEDLSIKEDMKEIELGAIPENPDEEAQGSEAQESQSEFIKDEDDMEMEAPASKTPGLKKGLRTPVEVWLPLTIPEIPNKGDFDVRRLRESKYFFS